MFRKQEADSGEELSFADLMKQKQSLTQDIREAGISDKD
jgi:hypothetical protein